LVSENLKSSSGERKHNKIRVKKRVSKKKRKRKVVEREREREQQQPPGQARQGKVRKVVVKVHPRECLK
jgi:hypothetical protein